MTTIRRLTSTDAPACDAILAALPYFFRDPAGLRNASRDVLTNVGWVTEDDGMVTGFLSLAWPTTETAEIEWMAVHPDYRHGGRGSLLLDEAVGFARDHGGRMLTLFTLPVEDPPDVTDGFEATRRFYSDRGFVRLWMSQPEGWSAAHLMMARTLR